MRGTIGCYAGGFLRGLDFGKLTGMQLQRIEDWVNNYLRKIFGYKSANDMYAAMI